MITGWNWPPAKPRSRPAPGCSVRQSVPVRPNKRSCVRRGVAVRQTISIADQISAHAMRFQLLEPAVTTRNKEMIRPIRRLENLSGRNIGEPYFIFRRHYRTPLISKGRSWLSIPTTCVIETPTSAETRRYSAICSSGMLPRKIRYSGNESLPCISGERTRNAETSSSGPFSASLFRARSAGFPTD